MKNILITGASGGMGLATTKYLAHLGYQVYALDIKQVEPIDNVTSFVVDLTKQLEIQKVLLALESSVKFDAIIHFVGTYYMDSLIEIDESHFKKIFDINFVSIYLVNKLFINRLNPQAKVIILSSELAPLDPLPFNGLYSLTKSLLEQYAISLRQELNLLGYQVVVVRPGAIATSMINESIANVQRMEQETVLYHEYVINFRKIVEANESKTIPPIKIAKLMAKIIKKSKPKLLYAINRNPKLMLLSMLPQRMQLKIIKKLLSKKKGN
ncbi:MAG: SDR family NAD(P)-dependent oxidoreductase [Bacilli bacterium]|nr:SDR family NAD(P)-dependent oxidoreductase [Bacilli bacterium]